jgi:hypothetical protein
MGGRCRRWQANWRPVSGLGTGWMAMGVGGHVHVGAHHPRRHLDLEPPAPPTSCRRCRCRCAHYSPEADGRNGGLLGVGQISTCTKRTAPGQVPAPCLLFAISRSPPVLLRWTKQTPANADACHDQWPVPPSTGYRLGQGARHARADVRTCVAL